MIKHNPNDPERLKSALDAVEAYVRAAEIAAVKKGQSNKPYYNERAAEQIKVLLDRLHTNGKPLRIEADTHSTTTLRLQFYQGAEYLCDHDASGHYAKIRAATECRTSEHYIELHIRKVPGKLSERAHEASPWKEDLLTFIDNAIEGQKFARTDVVLPQDDINWIHNQLIPLENLFVWTVARNEILVIRHTKKEEDNVNQ